jgi:hypothetical protein
MYILTQTQAFHSRETVSSSAPLTFHNNPTCHHGHHKEKDGFEEIRIQGSEQFPLLPWVTANEPGAKLRG